MENPYAAEVALLGTEKLLDLLQVREEYEPQIILAVIAELQNRQVEVANLEEIKEYTQAVYEAKLELENQPKTPSEKLKGFLQIFVQQHGYYITPVLLNLNLFVFIVMVLLGISFIEPEAGQLFAIGANYGPYTMSGDWWRLLTSTFIHAGILHLLLNMLALVSVGKQLEQMIGRVPFLIAYILCGLSGSLTSVWWDGTRVGVGASGAIFGMFGLMLVLLAMERKLTWHEKKAMLGNLGVVIGINLVYGMKGGIDNAAHSGGLAAGIILGAALMLRSNRLITQSYSLKDNLLMATAGLLVLLIAYNLLPFTGQLRYLYTVDRVVQNDTEALNVMQQIAEAGETAKSKSDVLVPQLEAGIKLWDESEVMLEEINDMTGKEEDRVLAMLDYVRLRKISYQMFIDDLKQNRAVFNPKQNQVLYAIDGYARALRQGTEGNVIDSRYKNDHTTDKADDAEMPQFSVMGEDAKVGEEEQSMPEKVLLVVNGVTKGFISPANMPEEVAGLDENDIESVTVLKGPEAKATYGEDGAQGVIVITTKK